MLFFLREYEEFDEIFKSNIIMAFHKLYPSIFIT